MSLGKQLLSLFVFLWGLGGFSAAGPAPTADLPWDGRYEPTTPPEQASPPWGVSLGTNTEAQAADGVLRLRDHGTQQTELRFYSRAWNASPREGAVAEVCLRVVSCSGPAGVVLLLADGVHEVGLTFYPDRVATPRAPRLTYAMNTTADFHVYRVWIRGQDLRLWVDGRLVIDGTGKFSAEAYRGRNLIGFGSCSSPATGEALWKYVRYHTFKPEVHLVPGAKHGIVYKRKGVYACFPSLRKTADDVLYAAFGTRVRRSHIDPTGGTARMKSTDGGHTWEPTKKVPENPLYRRKDGGLAYARAYAWRQRPAAEAESLKQKGYVVRTVRAGVVAYLSGAYAFKQTPAGTKTRWDLPVPPQASLMCYNQSALLKTSRGVRLVAVYGREKPGEPSTAWILRSVDDGDSWRLVPLARPLPAARARALQPEAEPDRLEDLWLPTDLVLGFGEPALAEATDGTLVAMLRPSPDRHGYLYASFSPDQGKTWTLPKRTPMWGYPANLLVLHDGSLLCTYGYRRAPMGIRACRSTDDGRTWDIAHEYVLRADGWGSGSDLGYPVTQQLADGRLVTVYYFTVADGITHIAVTHWRIPGDNGRKGR